MKYNRQQQTQIKRAVHDRLYNDFEFYAKTVLKIKTKAGQLEPFLFNKAQRYLDSLLDRQKAETGMVRAIILKGRQQGCSTYVAARYYRYASQMSAKSVFILSHQSLTTGKLFKLVERYHDNTNEHLRPDDVVSNRRELEFDNQSSYTVGTAGSAAIGRGDTNQYLHGSEVAFFENTDDFQTGALQTVASLPGTEVILESTANGIGNYFHKICMDALEGKGRYQLIFIPWYWQDEYADKLPPDGSWQPTGEDMQLKELYDLSDEQLYWRFLKTQELGSEWKFQQEYPFTVHEAFQTSGASLISAMALAQAQKSTIVDKVAPLIMGVDPARQGDRTVIVFRRGRQILKYEVYEEMDQMRLTGIVSKHIDSMGVDKCFIDFGMGYGTIDALHENGYADVVTGVHFGGKAMNAGTYLNKRAEMAGDLRDWLQAGGVSCPADQEFTADLLAVPELRTNSRNLQHLVPKDKIREQYGKSPDIFDGTILTFAYPVKSKNASPSRYQGKKTTSSKEGSPLGTRNRVSQVTKRGAGQ